MLPSIAGPRSSVVCLARLFRNWCPWTLRRCAFTAPFSSDQRQHRVRSRRLLLRTARSRFCTLFRYFFATRSWRSCRSVWIRYRPSFPRFVLEERRSPVPENCHSDDNPGNGGCFRMGATIFLLADDVSAWHFDFGNDFPAIGARVNSLKPGKRDSTKRWGWI